MLLFFLFFFFWSSTAILTYLALIANVNTKLQGPVLPDL